MSRCLMLAAAPFAGAFVPPTQGSLRLSQSDSVAVSSTPDETRSGFENQQWSGATALGGAVSIAAVALLARASSTRSSSRKEKSVVVRNFFGGSSTPAYQSFDPANEAGVQDPVGFWDPLGFSADKDEATFKRRRAVEIKHGRVCMYATMGYIVPEYFKFPGYLSPSEGIQFADVPNGLAAISKVPLLGWLQIVAFAGTIETTGFFSGEAKSIGFQKCATMDGEPGNYGVGFPNFIGTVDDPETRASKLAAELANGRLAMMAIIGMFFQDGLTGSAWGDWALYTASPLRAFESELGVQAPLGFWDPLGLSADGDAQAFARRRSV